MAVRGGPLRRGLQPAHGAYGVEPHRRSVLHLPGAARRGLPPRRQGADRGRYPDEGEARRSRRPGARPHRRGDRSDGACAPAGAGRPGPQTLWQRGSRRPASSARLTIVAHLSSLPVVIPFLVAPLLVVFGTVAPRWAED